MPVPEPVLAAARDFVARLRRRFGDRLGGDFRAESDVDLLVVIADLEEGERREAFDLAEEVFFDRLVHLSPLVYSIEEWRLVKTREYRIADEIEREGLSL